MLKSICHEEFYSSGTWIDESLGVYVGWTALKGSFCDGMPLCNSSRDLCLVFSGDEYSEKRVRFQQNSQDGNPRCGYLIQECERDRNFIASLNGLFHGLIADRRSGEVVLFNDRYGMHRLCYFQSQDSFYFAAEAKAIVAVQPGTREFAYKSMGEFASLGCVLEDRTIFKHINVLPGASRWEFKGAKLASKAQYFDPFGWEAQGPLPPEDYYKNLHSILVTNLPRYFAETQRMGIAMTGGLDTRVILANHPPSPGTLPGYTFGGPYRESQDVLIGRKVAGICQQSHQVIQVGKQFLAEFPEYAQRAVSITEGTVDLSRSADLYVSRKVRDIAPAKIVGTYGSEIVRHAVMFKPVEPPAGLFSPDFLPHVQEAASTYASVRSQHPVTFAAFRQSPWYHHGVLALEQSQLTVHSPFLDNDFVRMVYRAPKTNPEEDIRLRLIKDGSPALGRIPSDRAIGGDVGPLTSAIRHAFQEFTFKAEYAYDYGMPQAVARIDHFLSAFRLERLFLGRHKFLHFRVWYRDQLAGFVREMLLDPLSLSRPYIQKAAVETIVKGHLKGNHNYTTAIHRLLTMELLHRNFLDA
jgi:asparagine synthase (glutamine-hydrolysing)